MLTILACKPEIDETETFVETPEQELLNTGWIHGLVYDESDEAVADFTIELFINGKKLDHTQTDHKGEFAIEAPIKKDQDTRLFGYGTDSRPVLRRVIDLDGDISMDFPVISLSDGEVPFYALMTPILFYLVENT